MIAIKRASAIVHACVFTLSAWAGVTGIGGGAGGRNDGSVSIQLEKPAVACGVTLRPGAYTLRWVREHGSEDVRIEITHWRKVVAMGRGRWIESAWPSSFDGLVYHAEGGSYELAEIRFERSAESIQIEAVMAGADVGRSHGTVAN